MTTLDNDVLPVAPDELLVVISGFEDVPDNVPLCGNTVLVA